MKRFVRSGAQFLWISEGTLWACVAHYMAMPLSARKGIDLAGQTPSESAIARSVESEMAVALRLGIAK